NGIELNGEISRQDGTSAVDKAMNKHKSGNGYNETAVINELYLMARARKPSGNPTIYLPAKDAKGKERLDAKGKPIMTGPISEAAFLSNKVSDMKKIGAGPGQWRARFQGAVLSRSAYN